MDFQGQGKALTGETEALTLIDPTSRYVVVIPLMDREASTWLQPFLDRIGMTTVALTLLPILALLTCAIFTPFWLPASWSSPRLESFDINHFALWHHSMISYFDLNVRIS
jgi:hypothetical protein